MANVFKNMPSTKSIANMINTTISVEGQVYQFSDFIESEIISDFPTYSHRMRSTFVNAAKLVDTYLANILEKLNELETQLDTKYNNLSTEKRQEITTFIGDRKAEIAEYIRLRQEEIQAYINSKNEEFKANINKRNAEMTSKTQTFERWYNTKRILFDSKLDEINRKITQVNDVLQGVEAQENTAGLISISRVRTIVNNNVPVANENTAGKITEARVKQLIQTTTPTIKRATLDDILNKIST